MNQNKDLTIESEYLNAIIDLEFLRVTQKIDVKLIREEIEFIFLLGRFGNKFIFSRLEHKDC